MTFICTAEISVKTNRLGGEIFPVRCKRWSCEHCARINRMKVVQHAVDGKPTAMLTLTVSSNHYATPEEAAADLKRGLVALRKRITRKYPAEKMPFIAVFERHKSGYPHLHLLIRSRFLGVAWLRECWEEITGSWNVNITKIDPGRHFAYVTKYIGKDVAAFEGCKRWWRSHDYDLADHELTLEEARALQGWSRLTANIDRLTFTMKLMGFKVTKDRKDHFLWHNGETGPPHLKSLVAISERFGERRTDQVELTASGEAFS